MGNPCTRSVKGRPRTPSRTRTASCWMCIISWRIGKPKPCRSMRQTPSVMRRKIPTRWIGGLGICCRMGRRPTTCSRSRHSWFRRFLNGRPPPHESSISTLILTPFHHPLLLRFRQRRRIFSSYRQRRNRLHITTTHWSHTITMTRGCARTPVFILHLLAPNQSNLRFSLCMTITTISNSPRLFQLPPSLPPRP